MSSHLFLCLFIYIIHARVFMFLFVVVFFLQSSESGIPILAKALGKYTWDHSLLEPRQKKKKKGSTDVDHNWPMYMSFDESI